MFSTEDVENYYDLMYRLTKRKELTWTELENMTPYSRDIYVDMLIKDIEKENNKTSDQSVLNNWTDVRDM